MSLSTVLSSIPTAVHSAGLLPGVKCVDHLMMMSLAAAQFEADFRQFFDYDVALETCTAISRTPAYYKCKKTKFIKTDINDAVAHLKPQKFTISSDL